MEFSVFKLNTGISHFTFLNLGRRSNLYKKKIKQFYLGNRNRWWTIPQKNINIKIFKDDKLSEKVRQIDCLL